MRNARDLARNIWLQKHKDVFLPLLPASSKETKAFTDPSALKAKASYVPFHEIDKQPDSIAAGFMKDYQLHGLSFLVNMHLNGTSPSPFTASLYTDIRYRHELDTGR